MSYEDSVNPLNPRIKSFIFEDPEHSTFRVHRSAMTLPSVYEAEVERIFGRCWLYLGHESEVSRPGDFKTRWVGGRPLIFVRDDDGIVRAFLNSCPHRGAEVCREDAGKTKHFTCFYHGLTFTNKGKLASISGPDSYGPSFDKSALNLHEVRLQAYRGFVFVTFDRDNVDLVTYLADAKDYIDVISDVGWNGLEVISGTHKYSMRANWKMLPENSLDGLHAFTTHSTWITYLKDTGVNVSGGLKGFSRDLGNGHSVIDYHGVNGRPVALWEPLWGEDARSDIEESRNRLIEMYGEERALWIAERNKNLLIFPNLIFIDAMSLTVRTCWPVSHDYMIVTAWALGVVGELPEHRERRLESFLTFLGPGSFATPDDVEALDVCQRGLSTYRELEWSDMSRGMGKSVQAVDDEEPGRTYWRRWNELMTTPQEA